MGTLHNAKAGGQRRSLVACRPPSAICYLTPTICHLFRDLHPDPSEALAHMRAPVGPVVLPGPFVICEGNALLSGLPPERAVLVRERVFGAAIGEQRRNRRLPLFRDELFEAAARIARPPGRRVTAERG